MMALTDLLKSFVRASVLAASLYNCGGKETTVYPCRTSADCTSGTCVGGYCESPQDNYSSGSLCEDACRTLRDCCDVITGSEKVDCEEKDWNDAYCREKKGVSCLDSCVNTCEQNNAPPSELRCLAELECVSSFHDVYQCSGLDWLR